MSYITTKDGRQIYYKDWGKGPVVTFSHGWPLSSDAWDGQMLFLAQRGFRVVAHDRRGHGRSTQTSVGNDMDGYADDLAAVIEALDLKEATLVGHSTGGGEVARYIGRYGTKRVAKAVLIAAVPPLMLKTSANPEGLPIEVFDKMRADLIKDPSQILEKSRRIVLRRESTWCKSLTRNARSVLAVEHASRPAERLRKHQGVFGDGSDGGFEKIRRTNARLARGRRSDRSRQRLGEEIREADQRLAGNLLSGRATRHNRNPRRVGEFALARVFAARSADSAKGSVNLGRGGRSYDTQRSATRHNTSQNDG